MIICGYAGIGKSYLAHNFPNIIDLESTPFEKDWDRYYKCAKHYSNQGFLVLLSCHKEIRERVLSIPYGERITIFPCIEDKELFKKRYEQRGNNEDFIKLQMDNWEKWIPENNRLLGEHLEYMESGETLYDTIVRLSKLSPNRFCTYDGCPVPECSLMKDRCFNPFRTLVKTLATDLELENKNNNPKITVGTKIRSKVNPDVILSIISNDCHEDEFECSNGSVLSLKQIEKYYDIIK